MHSFRLASCRPRSPVPCCLLALLIGCLSLHAQSAPPDRPAEKQEKKVKPKKKPKGPVKPGLDIQRHEPCNLFELGESVELTARIIKFPAGKGEAVATVRNFWNKVVWKQTFPFAPDAEGHAEVALPIGKLPYGYYGLLLETSVKDSEGKPLLDDTGMPFQRERRSSFGVAEFVNRTAKEVREKGYAFGLKWWGGVTHPQEAEEAMVKLGLQWTRLIQNSGGDWTMSQILTEFPMNVVIKIERFPQELFDEERYGPIDEWQKKYGKGAWRLKTLPRKDPYQQWLREELAKIPADQNVFEIWNEPWDKMPPEDFAMLSQWIAEVVLKERPDAVLGPNLLGNTSDHEYDAGVIKAGGMKGMNMVALHPYGNSEDREWLRGYHRWVEKETGQKIDIYVTEFGSHSTPKGPAKRSEQEQAERVVRQSLGLHAEGVKVFLPHWLGQSEANPTYHEDWFGFLRMNMEPKPVLLAYANAARLIDGSRYVGDLWYGPHVGAMLFEQEGKFTLALWTLPDPAAAAAAAAAGETLRAEKEIEVAPGVQEVKLVDIGGHAEQRPVTDGRLKVELSEAPVYLVGVSPSLEKEATRELRADRFPKPEKPPRRNRVAGKLATPPEMDGKFEDWKGALELGISNPKVAGMDCSGSGYIAWDDQYLYVGVSIRDNEMLNKEVRAKLYREDTVEFFVSTEPRDSGRGFGPADHQFMLSPTSGEGRPLVTEVTDREAGVLEDIKGAKFFAGPTDKIQGWVIEAAIPWAQFKGFNPKKGAKLAMELRVNDADSSHERFKIDPVDVGTINVTDPSSWSFLTLGE